MTLGDDLKEVLQDVGLTFTIHKADGSSVSGEYLDYEVNRQVTKPFIREFFLEASLAYDTSANAGDLLSFDVDGRRFLVMNKTPELFENSITEFNVVLYKTNVSGEIYRHSGERDPDSLEMQAVWNRVSGAEALLTERLFGTELDQFSELGQLGIESNELYISGNIDVQPEDRFQVNPPSGEYWKIEVVKQKQFDNVSVCYLAEDTRA